MLKDHFSGTTPPDIRLTTARIDRKSTRLNSSHGYISYAVFCLKKKKNPEIIFFPSDLHARLNKFSFCDYTTPSSHLSLLPCSPYTSRLPGYLYSTYTRYNQRTN